ncbi:hypothetical protein [Halomonas korlensis]|uniref:hypothetical protein n=1 Tax=Halomonas korlensis TaxID=463301 RepID=UPI001FEC6DB9|nr:hypothetical protein [Halomonas korlensis]
MSALNDLLLISPRSHMMFDHPGLLLVATVAVPALGGLVVGLLHLAIPEQRPHAPADVIAAVQTRRGRLPPRAGGALGAERPGLAGLRGLGGTVRPPGAPGRYPGLAGRPAAASGALR